MVRLGGTLYLALDVAHRTTIADLELRPIPTLVDAVPLLVAEDKYFNF